MNWLKLSVASAAVLTVATAAQAQTMVDMSKITCEQLLRGTGNSIDAAVWMSGYYNGRQHNTMLDLAQLQQNAQAVVAECTAKPDRPLMQAIEALIAAGKKRK